MSSWMPTDPLRRNIIDSQFLINDTTIIVRLEEHNKFTSMPPPRPSNEHLRFSECMSQIWTIPSKDPDASNCPSVLKAKLQTESLWPKQKFKRGLTQK